MDHDRGTRKSKRRRRVNPSLLRRPTIAREIIASINQHLRSKGRALRYMRDHADHVDRGLEEGRNSLKAHLRAVRDAIPRGVPVGLKDRMKYLGWW